VSVLSLLLVGSHCTEG